MDIYAQVAQKIITEQESIIGPVAYEQARKVPGLSVDQGKKEVVLRGDGKVILQKLVEKYGNLFGQASVEVCKDAIRNLQVSPDNLPALLR